MKKVLAIVLALVMALSMSAMAFAADAAADVNAILNDIVAAAEDSTAAWDAVEGAIVKVIDAIEDKTANIDGEVLNLETLLDGVPGVDGLIDDLKGAIKDLYAGEVATVPETTAEAPAETGSSAAGIAVFAAVSVAAAAAYVCTKKN